MRREFLWIIGFLAVVVGLLACAELSSAQVARTPQTIFHHAETPAASQFSVVPEAKPRSLDSLSASIAEAGITLGYSHWIEEGDVFPHVVTGLSLAMYPTRHLRFESRFGYLWWTTCGHPQLALRLAADLDHTRVSTYVVGGVEVLFSSQGFVGGLLVGGGIGVKILVSERRFVSCEAGIDIGPGAGDLPRVTVNIGQVLSRRKAP